MRESSRKYAEESNFSEPGLGPMAEVALLEVEAVDAETPGTL